MADTFYANLYDNDHVESVRKVSHDLKRLLKGCDAARLKTDVKLNVVHLNAWTDSYLKGLDAAQKISESGYDTLIATQKELGLALDDYLRFEGEGGNPPSPQQEARIDEISHALSRISRLMSSVEETFSGAEEPEVTPPEPEVSPQPEPAGNPELPSEIPPVSQPEAHLA